MGNKCAQCFSAKEEDAMTDLRYSTLDQPDRQSIRKPLDYPSNFATVDLNPKKSIAK